MTSINEKLGLKPAGKRAMMKLPQDLTLRAAITAAICPACARRGARLSALVEGELWCSWCGHHWPLPDVTTEA
jgi:hypothetical protein